MCKSERARSCGQANRRESQKTLPAPAHGDEGLSGRPSLQQEADSWGAAGGNGSGCLTPGLGLGAP